MYAPEKEIVIQQWYIKIKLNDKTSITDYFVTDVENNGNTVISEGFSICFVNVHVGASVTKYKQKKTTSQIPAWKNTVQVFSCMLLIMLMK